MLDIYIRLNNYDHTKPEETLKLAAQEVSALNDYWTTKTKTITRDGEQVEVPYLEYGPIACNPESTTLEGFVGDVNTPPNELGYVTMRIDNYDSLEWEVMPTSFVVVSGYPRRGENDEILPGAII